MVKQYPHYLFAIDATDSEQNESGDFTESNISYRFLSMCREEVNSKGMKLNIGGGKFIEYKSLIQIPNVGISIKAGQRVAICNDMDRSEMRISGECLRFEHSQLHSRLWL